ncbi:MAG TPA: molybdopterin-dependent oxidoreductase [Thermoleophilia bacterium]|nr:molybdopterin-dependent oxidoreductase [Thermoleophilia bacterium]
MSETRSDIRCLVPDGVTSTVCMQCPWGCGINVHIEKGAIARISGNKNHPFSNGTVCPKGTAAGEVLTNPRRITSPMRRTESGWEPISWDSAYEILVEQLTRVRDEYGPKALAVAIGMPVLLGGNSTVSFLRRFCDIYGTPNCFSVESICFRCQIIARILTLGAYEVPDITNSACVLVWGNNPQASAPPAAARIREALEKGAKLIVIDPRATEFAAQADVHLQVRPGTDTALALSMIDVMATEGLIDREFVAAWTVGMDELAEVASDYPPTRAAEITGVPAEKIVQAARMFAGAASACIVQGTNSLDQHATGLQNSRCVAILQAITGNIDNPGGFVSTSKVRLNPIRLPELMEGQPLGADRYPLFNEVWGRNFGEGQAMLLADTILSGDPYPIKAMIVSASNPVITWPGGRKLERAMESLDFLAVMDLYMTPTAEKAHLFLPAATFMERVELCDYYGTLQAVPYVAMRRKMFQVGEAISDVDFWIELGKRMGYGELLPWSDAKEALDYALEPSGFTLADLDRSPDGGMPFGSVRLGHYLKKGGFATPSGKIELASATLRDLGHDAVPRHRDSPEGPDSFMTAADSATAGGDAAPAGGPAAGAAAPSREPAFPLVLTTGARLLQYLHSGHRDIERLAKRGRYPQAELHPDTARRYGIEDDVAVEIETRHGTVQMRARVTEAILPGVVSLPHGWNDASVNDLTDDYQGDPITGYPILKSKACRIRAVAAVAE